MGEHVVDRQGCQEVGDQDLFGKALEDQKESIVKSLSRYVGRWCNCGRNCFARTIGPAIN